MADALHDTSWVLDGPFDLPDGVEVVISFDDGSVVGFSGCNRFRGTYRVDGESLELGALGSTMMACSEDAMEVEREVLRRMASVSRFVVGPNGLALTLGEDEVLLTFRAQGSDGLLGDWAVNGIHHPQRHAILSVRGDLQLTIEDDRISGNAGCNRFSGPLATTDGGLQIGPLMSTRMFCEDEEAGSGPTIMEQESALLAALEGATGHRLEGSRLTLTRPDGGIAVSLHRP
ncbi:MAG: META domain-containing protein [Ilumatobacteraceae bacterium]